MLFLSWLKSYSGIIAPILGVLFIFYCGYHVRGLVEDSRRFDELKEVNETLLKDQAATNVIVEETEAENAKINSNAVKHAEALNHEDKTNPVNCTYSPERVRIINSSFGAK